MLIIDDICPCNKNNSYSECCGVLHKRQSIASTAEMLMRSRYSAWALHLIDYIFDTTWPFQKQLLNKEEMEKWSSKIEWIKLVVDETKDGGVYDDLGMVKFTANYTVLEVDKNEIHYETSYFIKQSNVWFYVYPDMYDKPPLSRNEECLCGSGKKFKRCCLERCQSIVRYKI